MTNELDILLSNPLPEIADRGFSARVVNRITAEHLRRARVEATVAVVGVVAVLAILPFTDFGAAITQTTGMIGTSVPVAAALAALVLSNVLAGTLRE